MAETSSNSTSDPRRVTAALLAELEEALAAPHHEGGRRLRGALRAIAADVAARSVSNQQLLLDLQRTVASAVAADEYASAEDCNTRVAELVAECLREYYALRRSGTPPTPLRSE
jgi:hypothetical protein